MVLLYTKFSKEARIFALQARILKPFDMYSGCSKVYLISFFLDFSQIFYKGSKIIPPNTLSNKRYPCSVFTNILQDYWEIWKSGTNMS